MEDRKRPALDDSAPPSKRQAVAVNGNSTHPDADMPWRDDIEVGVQACFTLCSSSPLTFVYAVAISKGCYTSTNARVQEGEDESRNPIGFHDETLRLS